MKYRLSFGLVVMLACFPSIGSAGSLSQAAPPAQGVIEQEVPEPLTIPSEYEYEPRGRRDPFVNPLTPEEVVAVAAPPEVRPLGLPGVLLNEAVLTAVVTSPDSALNVVVVQAPGGRIFIARPGDELFDAVIREIRPDIVVFNVKRSEGSDPAVAPEVVVRPLSPRPGD